MKIHCICSHEYETRSLPCPDGIVGCLVPHTDRESYICEKCGAFNAPRLSEGVWEEIGVGVANIESISALELYAPVIDTSSDPSAYAAWLQINYPLFEARKQKEALTQWVVMQPTAVHEIPDGVPCYDAWGHEGQLFSFWFDAAPRRYWSTPTGVEGLTYPAAFGAEPSHFFLKRERMNHYEGK